MSHHHHRLAEGERPFPLPPLIGAATLIILTLLAVAAVRLFDDPTHASVARSEIVASRALLFEDAANGSVVVRDAADNGVVRHLAAGEHGFVRATVRGLVRSRRARGADDEIPFLLELRRSGRLLLIDPLTGQEVDLWAFGATNAEQFSGFLDGDSLVRHEDTEFLGVAR